MPHRAAILLLVGWVGILCAQASEPLDVTVPPSAEAQAELMEGGWETAYETVASALAEQYGPAAPATPAYVGWLRFAQWCALLGRAEGAAFQDYVRSSLERGEFRIAVGPEGRLVTAADVDRFVGNAHFRAAVVETMLPQGYRWQGGPIGDRLPPALRREFLLNERLGELVFNHLSAHDFAPMVVQHLADLRTRFPEEWEERLTLAVTLALVFDQRTPRLWPHRQVEATMLLADTSSVEERFAYWVARDDAGELRYPLRELDVVEQSFVVDACVPFSELDWVRGHVTETVSSFGRVFSGVAYRMDRIHDQKFVWPHGRYALSNIVEHGGICVDQAYFAAMAGKAHGIPTLYFSGQGSDGGHAWFGFKKDSRRWELDAGRFENQNYAVGEALDPRSWTAITDHELQALTSGLRATRAYRMAQIHWQVADVFAARNDAAGELRAVDAALRTCPDHSDLWFRKAALLELTQASSISRREFLRDAILEFSGDNDVKARFQQLLAEVSRAEGNDTVAGMLENRIINSNRRERADLSIGTAWRQLEGLMEQGDQAEAWRLYRNVLRKLGATGGGQLMYDLVRPFVLELERRGEGNQAREALALARDHLRPTPGSILDQDIRRLESGLSE